MQLTLRSRSLHSALALSLLLIPRTLGAASARIGDLEPRDPRTDMALALFSDGLESGTTCSWSAAFPVDDPPAVVCGLESFLPSFSFAREGALATPTIPVPLTVRLRRPAASPTFVSISSGGPEITVPGDGVTISTSATDAVVFVNALAAAPGVDLSASLDAVTLIAQVRVVSAAEVPVLVDLTPAAATIPPGVSISLTVHLDIPAPPGGTTISLALNPANAGAIPPQITVLQDQMEAAFTYVDANTATSAQVIATLGPDTQDCFLTIQ